MEGEKREREGKEEKGGRKEEGMGGEGGNVGEEKEGRGEERRRGDGKRVGQILGEWSRKEANKKTTKNKKQTDLAAVLQSKSQCKVHCIEK